MIGLQIQLADRTPDIFLHDRLLWEYPEVKYGVYRGEDMIWKSKIYC